MSVLKEFKAGCETYREQLLNTRLVTAEEIAKQWPGGEYNPSKGLKGWAGAYGWLKGACLRIKDRDEKREKTSADRRAAVLDAIAEMPETVELVGRDKDEKRYSLTIYQKSDIALRVIHGLNMQLAELVDGYRALVKRSEPNDADLLPRILAEQSYLQRVIVWIASTPGAGLPFPEGAIEPALPADRPEILHLHPLDFYTLAQAFQRVNVAGFAALDSGTSPRTRSDWSVFWSGMEKETGIPAPRLMRDRGLLSLVATASERARVYEEAERKSKKGAA